MKTRIAELLFTMTNCLAVLPQIESDSVASIVTDPPYELGFMGKSWDRSGIAYNVEVWRECLRVLKPGGHLLAFGGSRTYHRLACALGISEKFRHLKSDRRGGRGGARSRQSALASERQRTSL